MKKTSFVLLIFVLLLIGGFFANVLKAHGAKGVSGSSRDAILIDSFEDAVYTKRVWSKEGNIKLLPIKNSTLKPISSDLNRSIEKYSLQITGKATNWYVGSLNRNLLNILNADFSQINAFLMDVFGNGRNSGTITVVLGDDDDKNGKFDPKYDDRGTYKVNVTWIGWKRVIIPISAFSLDKSIKGNRILNLSNNKIKGNLAYLQLMFIATMKDGSINMNIDNITLIK